MSDDDLALPLPGEHAATPANYDRVTTRMTRDQMLDILGREDCTLMASADGGDPRDEYTA